jgi:hypothetical protein
MDTQLTFTDKEYIGDPDDELATQEAVNTLETFQTPELDPAELNLANSWFLS